MQTPVCKKAVDSHPVAADTSISKPLPPLAAVRINHSRMGSRLYRGSYSLFALSLLLTFSFYIIDEPVWLVGLVLCWSGLWLVYRRESNKCVTGALSYWGDHWLLEQDGRTCQVDLAGEVLCWAWLIVLPLRDAATGKTRWLLIFSDAVNKDDNARLRRWLRACLNPKA